MIAIKLMGGLGNQMFQYAIGRRISLEQNVPLKLDLSFLSRRDMGQNFIYRDYDLGIFILNSDLDPITPKVLTINQPYYHHAPEIIAVANNMLQAGKHILLEGYWQTPKYFESCEKQLRDDFNFRNKVQETDKSHILDLLGVIETTDSVMVNIRRADYLNTNFHGVMGMEYVKQASRLISERVKNPKYFVFSDDIEWCLANIHLPNVTFVNHTYAGKKFEYYMQLMKACKHFIIPNSTFAWWTAWLNTSPEKIVIAPKKWFNDPNINTIDLVPSDWIRI